MIRHASRSKRYTRSYPLEAALAACGPGRADYIRTLYALVANAGGTVWGCELKYGELDVSVELPGGEENSDWPELQRICTAADATCEWCGAPGVLRDDREFWRVLCDEHA